MVVLFFEKGWTSRKPPYPVDQMKADPTSEESGSELADDLLI